MAHPAIELECSVCQESLFIKAGDEKPDQFIDLVESYDWHETENGEWLCDDCWIIKEIDQELDDLGDKGD